MLTRIKDQLRRAGDALWLWRNRKRLRALQQLFMPEIIQDGKLVVQQPRPDGKGTVAVDVTPQIMTRTMEKAANDAMNRAIVYLKDHPELQFGAVASGRPLQPVGGAGPIELPSMVRKESLANYSKEALDRKLTEQLQKDRHSGLLTESQK